MCARTPAPSVQRYERFSKFLQRRPLEARVTGWRGYASESRRIGQTAVAPASSSNAQRSVTLAVPIVRIRSCGRDRVQQRVSGREPDPSRRTMTMYEQVGLIFRA